MTPDVPFQQHVTLGGHFLPRSGCGEVLFHVALVIPIRGRDSHLKVLLNRLHPLLQGQRIEYRVFVVTQVRTDRSIDLLDA